MFLSVVFIAASSAFDSPNKWYKSARATGGYGSTAKIRANPERSASQSVSRFNEQLKTFTGVTGSGQKRILIPSLRSMR